MEVINLWKVVTRTVTPGVYRSAIESKFAKTYRTGKVAVTSRAPARHGYHMVAFDSLVDAKQFLSGLSRVSHAILACVAKADDVFVPTKERADLQTLEYCDHFIDVVELACRGWPEGTMMVRRLLVVGEVEL
jgi:hypothetical protein